MKTKQQNTIPIEPLYTELHDDLHVYFARRVESSEAAEDLVQETFLKFLRALEQGRTVSNAEAYLFRLARNLVIDHYRTRRHSSPPPELLDESQEDARNEETRRVIAGWMRDFISTLPSPYRETLLLSEFHGLPYSEIAGRTGGTVGTVKSRVHRGRKLLRERLITCCRFHFDAAGRVVDYEPHHWTPAKNEERPDGSNRSRCSDCE